MSHNQTLREIFTPSPQKLLLALLVTVFAHLFLVVADLRQAGESAELIRQFWLANLINALPYLETSNMFLKFLTFFTVSYLIVWVLSRLFAFLGNVHREAGKRFGGNK